MTLSNQQITRRFKDLAKFYNGNEKQKEKLAISHAEKFTQAIATNSGVVYQMGEAIDQLFRDVNNGIGLRQVDTDQLKRKNISKATKETHGFNNDVLPKVSQRLSEAHRLFTYNTEISEWLGTCDNPPASLQNIYTAMNDDGSAPWPVKEKAEKTVDDLAKAINKLIEKSKFSLTNVIMSVENLNQRKDVHAELQADIDAKAQKLKARADANNKVLREKNLTQLQIDIEAAKADQSISLKGCKTHKAYINVA